jgi:iron(III) transport system substrate-binding protein
MDFLVSPAGQQLFAEQNYEYPLLPGTELREGVAPLEDYRLTDVDVAQAAQDFEATFDLIEKLGLP